jgi:hypothetical protein
MNDFTFDTTGAQTSFWLVEGTAARKLQPDEQVEADHVFFNEDVKVYAIYREDNGQEFFHNRLRPLMFIWHNREYHVRDVTYVWRENQGQSEVYHFTVSDGASVFELAYHVHSLDWKISGTYSE